MEHPFRAPGVELITQQYLADRGELRSRTDLTPAQRDRLAEALASEHGLRCTQEWRSALAQMRDDQEAGSRSLPEPIPLSRRAHEGRPSQVDAEDDEGNEKARREIRHEEAWERYLQAERRDLKLRQEGRLATVLGAPLPKESPEDLKRLAEGDRLKAIEGLVAIKSESGEIVYTPLSDLTPEDRRKRFGAEGEQIAWIVERTKKRSPSSP